MACIFWVVMSSIALLSSIQGCLAWHGMQMKMKMLSTPNLRNQSYRQRLSSRCRSPHPLPQAQAQALCSSSSTNNDYELEGVRDFESWFSGAEGSKCNPYIKHASFGELRGLGTFDRSIASGSAKERGSWMTVPRAITLSSDFSQPDWDSQLAESLWKEVMKGSTSPIHGYASLLTKSWSPSDLPKVPPFAAPDALRHWSDEEKEALVKHPKGKSLLDLQTQQDQTWREKYKALRRTGRTAITWEQFEWAMEAVSSRAFCGDFGIGGGSSLPNEINIGVPTLAALASYIYFVPLHGTNDIVLFLLAVFGSIPTVFNVLKESPPVAVLLPLIDSANHLEEADSSIEYSPLTDSFELSGGPGCLLQEENGMQQLYISYGKKSDRELLLNYGFLRGNTYYIEDETERRKQLAEKFISS